MKPLKIALYYDWLNQWGGAERVFLDILKIYPEATVFTLVWDKKKTGWLPRQVKAETTWLDRLPWGKKNPVWYTPFYDLALEQIDLRSYDLVIATTSTVGHGLLTGTDTKYVCYYHNINRYVYETPKKYKWLKPLLKMYAAEDRILSQRPDVVLCNSNNVSERIKAAYGRGAKVVYPGVDTEEFVPGGKKKDYFLTVSRLVEHKKINLAVEACGQLGCKLKIVGDGRDRKKIENLAKRYPGLIEILGWVDQGKLLELYQESLGLLHPQVEDFGLTPLEAQACGRGVVALAKGGALETVIPGVTGVLFEEQSVDGLKRGIQKYLKMSINSEECRSNAIRFSRDNFMLNFRKEIDNLWEKKDQS